jgi:hypothetical protein
MGSDRASRRVNYGTVLFFLGPAVGLIILGLVSRPASDTSAYTQAHGVPRQATVVSVDRQPIYSKTSIGGKKVTGYKAAVTATLDSPVGGQSQTTVYAPHDCTCGPGQEISVLVDPREPGHSELPGDAAIQPSLWLAFLIGGGRVGRLGPPRRLAGDSAGGQAERSHGQH